MVFTRVKPSRHDLADMSKAMTAVEHLSAFDTGHAVVVVRAYILAVAAGETTLAMLGRTRSLRQWGIGAKHRRGVLACRLSEPDGAAIDPGALIDQAAAQGLAGVAVLGPGGEVHMDYLSHADRHGLFVIAERWG